MSKFQIFLILALAIAVPLSSSRAEEEYPEATTTPNPDVVVSPFPPNKKINVAGFLPGDLARDPHTNKVFRIPARKATPLVFKPDIVEDDPEPTTPRPPSPPATRTPADPDSLPIRRPEIIEEPDPTDPTTPPAPTPQIPVTGSPNDPDAPAEPPIPVAVPATVITARPPKDISGALDDFIKLFIRSGQADDPLAQAQYFASAVTPYYNLPESTKDQVVAERQALITQWPRRIYVISGKPRFVRWISSKEDEVDEFAVDVRVYQSLKGTSGNTQRGYADHRLSIREVPDGSFEIIGAEERLARSVLADP